MGKKSIISRIKKEAMVQGKGLATKLAKQARQKAEKELQKRVLGQGKYNVAKASHRVGTAISKALASKIAGMGLYQPAVGGRGLYVKGRGSYTTNSLIMDQNSRGSVPAIHHMGDETTAVRVTHKEYIGDVYAPGVSGGGAVAFQNVTYNLNPGLQALFPFLAQLAMNYVDYEFEQLIFEFRSTTTDIGNSTTGQCGTIIMAVSYNANDLPFADKPTMMEYAHSVSNKVTENVYFGVECDPAKRAGSDQLFVRSNPVVSGQDLKTYDHGVLNIAIANCPSAYNGLSLGELWVHYTVRLSKSRLYASKGYNINSDLFIISSTLDSTITPTLLLGTVGNKKWLIGQQNNIGSSIAGTSTGFKLTFPANFSGNVRLELAATGTGLTAAPSMSAVTGNVVQISDQYVVAAPVSAYSVVTTTNFFFQIDLFISPSTSGVDNSATFTGCAGTTLTNMCVRLGQYACQCTMQNQLNSTTSRIQWVNSSGVVTVPT